MERGESVNAADLGEEAPDFESPLPEDMPVLPASGDLGPCLYFGPAGQRCNRRAVAGSFCARHQPGGGAAALSLPQITRRGVALLGLMAVLWPVVADLIRALIRLLR